MEISEKQETTVITTRSIEIGELLIGLEITKTEGQTKHVSLSRVGRGAAFLIPNTLHLFSMEEAQAALELLKAIVEDEANV